MAMDLEELRRELRTEAASVAPADRVAARRGVDAHIRRHRVRRGAAVVVAVVLVAAVGAALVGRHGQSAERVVTNSGPVPHLVPAFMSDQVRFSHVVDLPVDRASNSLPAERLWIYATGASGDALAGSSFGVLAVEFPSDPTPSDTALVRASPASTPARAGLRGAGFRVDATTSFEVLSAELSNEQLRAIGETVRVGADGHLPRLVERPYRPATNRSSTDASGGSLSAAGRPSTPAPGGTWRCGTAVTPDEEGIRHGVRERHRVHAGRSRCAALEPPGGDPGRREGQIGGAGLAAGGREPGRPPAAGTEDRHLPVRATWMLSWFLADGTTRVTIQAIGGLSRLAAPGTALPGARADRPEPASCRCRPVAGGHLGPPPPRPNPGPAPPHRAAARCAPSRPAAPPSG